MSRFIVKIAEIAKSGTLVNAQEFKMEFAGEVEDLASAILNEFDETPPADDPDLTATSQKTQPYNCSDDLKVEKLHVFTSNSKY